MSVLIKDMEKPKSCYAAIDGEFEYCPFVNTDDDCVLLLKKGTCDGTWEEQYSKCPLVELPSAQPDRSLWFRIGELCVNESKGDITAEVAIEKVRALLRAERREE